MAKKRRFLAFSVFWLVANIIIFFGFLFAAIYFPLTGNLGAGIFFGVLAIALGLALIILLMQIAKIDKKGITLSSNLIFRKKTKHLDWKEIVEVGVINIYFMKMLYCSTEILTVYEKLMTSLNRDKRVVMIMRGGKKIQNAIHQYYFNDIIILDRKGEHK